MPKKIGRPLNNRGAMGALHWLSSILHGAPLELTPDTHLEGANKMIYSIITASTAEFARTHSRNLALNKMLKEGKSVHSISLVLKKGKSLNHEELDSLDWLDGAVEYASRTAVRNDVPVFPRLVDSNTSDNEKGDNEKPTDPVTAKDLMNMDIPVFRPWMLQVKNPKAPSAEEIRSQLPENFEQIAERWNSIQTEVHELIQMLNKALRHSIKASDCVLAHKVESNKGVERLDLLEKTSQFDQKVYHLACNILVRYSTMSMLVALMKRTTKKINRIEANNSTVNSLILEDLSTLTGSRKVEALRQRIANHYPGFSFELRKPGWQTKWKDWMAGTAIKAIYQTMNDSKSKGKLEHTPIYVPENDKRVGAALETNVAGYMKVAEAHLQQVLDTLGVDAPADAPVTPTSETGESSR